MHTENQAPASTSLLNTAPTQSTTQQPASTQAELMSDGWLKGIDKSLATDPSLSSIQDLPNLVKSYVNAQKLLGRDKVVVPTEGAAPEEWQQVFEKLGVPKDPKEYQFKDKFEYDENYLNDFKAFAKENGLLPRQAEALLKRIQAEDHAMSQAEEEQSAQAFEEAKQDLFKTYGEALDKKLQLARHALTNLADKQMLEYVDQSGMSNDPNFVKFLVKIGEKFFREDEVIQQASQGGKYTPSEAQSKIAAINGDMKHPYWNGDHPQHKHAVDEMAELFRLASIK